MTAHRLCLACGVFAACAIADDALGGGFANDIQSASGASTALAGVTANAFDASALFYNPATLSQLRRAELTAATGIVFPSISFTDAGSTDATGGALRGGTSSKNDIALVPSVFAAVPIGERLHLGVGLYAPFGQATKYDEDWIGRYHVQETSITTVEITPAVAFRVTDWMSVGAGLAIQYARFRRKAAIDFGSACFGALGPFVCTGLGLAPQAADGRIDVKVDDWGVRYLLGLTVEPWSGTRLGLSYRSSIRHDLAGDADFTVPPAAIPLAGGAFSDTGARARVTFPEILSFGLAQQVSDRLAVFADLAWTRWNHLDRLTLEFDNPAQPLQSQALSWRNTMRVSAGIQYQLAERVALRGGIAFDETPIEPALRAPDLPQGDRLTLASGISYRIGDAAAVALSYSYDREFGGSVDRMVAGAGILRGEFEREGHSLGLQMTLVF